MCGIHFYDWFIRVFYDLVKYENIDFGHLHIRQDLIYYLSSEKIFMKPLKGNIVPM
jgi:hypothetical protein